MNTSFEPKTQEPKRRASHEERQSAISYPSRTIVHAKLEMTSPGDQDEQEADAVANEVVNGGKIARKISGGGGSSGIAVPRQMESRLMHSQGGGEPLPSGLRSQMESGFGRDFSQVRLHTGSNAAALSSSIHAKAFSYGNDIYFNQGQFSPQTVQGQHLVAHELTHVVQGGGGKVRRERMCTNKSDNYNQLAERIVSISNKVHRRLDDVLSKFNSYDSAKAKSPERVSAKLAIQGHSVYQSYEKYVSADFDAFRDFCVKVRGMLSDLNNNVCGIELRAGDIIKKSDNGIDVVCDTVSGMRKMNPIDCYSSWIHESDLNERAYSIIHEFSHMWIDTNDACYWSVEENDSDYCGKITGDKSRVASAIEYFIKDIYRTN